MSELLNANPTIRDTSDLPTRLRNASDVEPKDARLKFYETVIAAKVSNEDPFDSYLSDSAPESDGEQDEETVEPIDEQEIYDLIATISDPEHPTSLASLSVVNLPDISITKLGEHLHVVNVEITPTVSHCSLATAIGLGVRVRLEQSLPPRFRVDVRIKEGTHSTGDQVNKQLGDKERVAAALENAQLMTVIRKMLETCQ